MIDRNDVATHAKINHLMGDIEDAMDGVCSHLFSPEQKRLLIESCKAVLEAAGYVCLQKHTDPPTTPGDYAIYTEYVDDKYRPRWDIDDCKHAHDSILLQKESLISVCYALGPLPKQN